MYCKELNFHERSPTSKIGKTSLLLTTSFDSLTQMSTHGSDESHGLKKIPLVFTHYLIPDDACPDGKYKLKYNYCQVVITGTMKITSNS